MKQVFYRSFLNKQILASFLRSTHPARSSLPASASLPVKIHVGEIKIIRSTGGTHLGDIGRMLNNGQAFCVRCVLRCGLCRCALRVFVVACVFACAAFCLCGTTAEGKRGATRGKRPWVFSPRAFRADECGRMHSRSALPEKSLELNCFLKI